MLLLLQCGRFLLCEVKLPGSEGSSNGSYSIPGGVGEQKKLSDEGDGQNTKPQMGVHSCHYLSLLQWLKRGGKRNVQLRVYRTAALDAVRLFAPKNGRYV